MATETATPPAPSAQVVGNAFVEQYYSILHKSPESVHRFYQNSSVLSRPEPNGLVTTVTTIKGIHDKICSFDYKKYTAEIKTADAQDSHNNGVIVLVTGSITGPENIQKKFTQSFFLAPQDKGYFVLNDVLRYVEDSVVPLENKKVATQEAVDSALEPTQVVGSLVMNSSTPHLDKVQNVNQKVHDQVANKNASILSSQTKKGVLWAAKAYVPINGTKVLPKKIENKAVATVAYVKKLAPKASASASVVESKKDQEDKGHSIYVQNLPLNVMASEVEEEFRKFGPIKRGGVQVRNSKQKGSFFGFVEFENLSSMNDAIQASPITIGGWKAIVEKKKTTTRVGSGKGRFSSGRGGFRKRENYVNGRGYGRNEFANRGEFSGQGRGQGGRVRQQGRGQGGSNPIDHSPEKHNVV